MTCLPGGPAVHQLNLHPPSPRLPRSSLAALVHADPVAVIFVAVFSVMFYSIWKHRKSVGHKPANFHESVTVEIIWTIIPFIIVILMALFATKVLVAPRTPPTPTMTIKADRLCSGLGLRLPEGRRRRHLPSSPRWTKHAPRMSNAAAPKGGVPVDDYLLKVDNPLVVPVGRRCASSPPPTT